MSKRRLKAARTRYVNAPGEARRHTKRHDDSSHILIQASGIVRSDISFLVVMCSEGKKETYNW